jgi:hypothetical protein
MIEDGCVDESGGWVCVDEGGGAEREMTASSGVEGGEGHIEHSAAHMYPGIPETCGGGKSMKKAKLLGVLIHF